MRSKTSDRVVVPARKVDGTARVSLFDVVDDYERAGGSVPQRPSGAMPECPRCKTNESVHWVGGKFGCLCGAFWNPPPKGCRGC